METTAKLPTKWNKENITNLLQNNNEFLKRALLKLYDFQTQDEQQSEETKHNNGVGFTGADGRVLTSIAHFLQSRKFLSDKQIALVRKRILKYATQIANISNEITKGSNTPAKVKITLQEVKVPEAPQHIIHESGQFCSCDADTYVCQVCANIKCSTQNPSEWRVDITKNSHAGNVCPKCLAKHEALKDNMVYQAQRKMELEEDDNIDPAGGHGLHSHE